MSSFSSLKTAIANAIKANGNQEITGNLLQGILLSIVETLGDSAINILETDLSNEATTRGNADTELNNLITGVKNNVDNGYVYAGIATPSTTPVSGKVFYIALQAGTYTNFGGTTVTEGIIILKYNGTSWVKEQVLFTDGGVFDISAYHATGGNLAKYADLTAALGTSGANIPQSIRKGGMSVKFVQTDDNKYVQYRLMSDEWSTTESDWQGVDDEPTAGSGNLVKSGGTYPYSKGIFPHIMQALNYNKQNLLTENIYFIYGSIKTNPSLKGIFCAVKAGDVYTYYGAHNSELPLVVGFTTLDLSDYTIIVGSMQTYTSVTFAIPENVHYICAWGGNLSTLYYESSIAYEIDYLNVRASLRTLDVNFNNVGYYDKNGKLISNSESFVATDWIPVKEGDIITYSGGHSPADLYLVLGVSKDGIITNLYSDNYWQDNVRITIPSNVIKIAAWSNTVRTPKLTVFGDNRIPSSLIAVGEGLNYTKISDAVNDIITGGTVIVYPGEYNDETIECWGKTVNIIGIDKDLCIIKNNTGNYSTPPIEIGSGSLKNLTIIAGNGSPTETQKSYGVHIEDSSMYNGGSLIIENCNIYSTYNACIGMGFYGGTKITIKNCVLKRISDENSGYALFMHPTNNSNLVGITDLTIENCLFYSTNDTVWRIDNYITGNTVNFTVIGNILYSQTPNHSNGIWFNNSVSDPDGWKNMDGWNLVAISQNNNNADLNFS